MKSDIELNLNGKEFSKCFLEKFPQEGLVFKNVTQDGSALVGRIDQIKRSILIRSVKSPLIFLRYQARFEEKGVELIHIEGNMDYPTGVKVWFSFMAILAVVGICISFGLIVFASKLSPIQILPGTLFSLLIIAFLVVISKTNKKISSPLLEEIELKLRAVATAKN